MSTTYTYTTTTWDVPDIHTTDRLAWKPDTNVIKRLARIASDANDALKRATDDSPDFNNPYSISLCLVCLMNAAEDMLNCLDVIPEPEEKDTTDGE